MNKDADAPQTRGTEVDADWYLERKTPPFGLLCTVNVENREVERLTDDSLNVQSFEWSPDGKRLAVAASEDTRWASYIRTDLFVLDRETSKVRTLIKQEGRDDMPVWSPDGKQIAFRSQKGREDWTYYTWLALVPASGGSPTYLTDKFQNGTGGSPRELFWTNDGKEIYFTCFHRMSHQLFRVSADKEDVVKVTPDDSQWYSQFSYSRATKTLAFTVENITQPTDICFSTLSLSGIKKLTDLNPQLREIAHAQVKTISWKSTDDKWDIHGVLVKPPNYRPGKRYPLLLLLYGGPSMVSMEYGLHRQFPVEVLAAEGYLVLAPNTRGRGGYGYAFAHAIGNEKSYGIKPLEDALAGVDELIRREVVDPSRLGIMGHSYGGYLTALAITQTDKFKAASVSEAFAGQSRSRKLRREFLEV